MALQKQENWNLSTTQPTANYHRISASEFVGVDGIRATVASFFDAASYAAGNEPYTHRMFEFVISDHPDLEGVLRDKTALGAATDVKTELYLAIKADAVQHGGFFNSGTTDV